MYVSRRDITCFIHGFQFLALMVISRADTLILCSAGLSIGDAETCYGRVSVDSCIKIFGRAICFALGERRIANHLCDFFSWGKLMIVSSSLELNATKLVPL